MDKKQFKKLCDELPVFFLGANSSKGFVSAFSRVADREFGERLYIIKGGPGTGKSSLMKTLLGEALKTGDSPEMILCSTDPESLDGIVIASKKCAVIDGTPPHTVEPKYPGVSDRMIPLSECLDSDKLGQEADEIISLCKTNSSLHKKASRHIGASGELLTDNFAIACGLTKTDEVLKAASNLCSVIFDVCFQGEGKEKIRFLSGVTPDGIKIFDKTLSVYADKIIAIDDEYGVVSSVILSAVRKKALSNGYDIITCPCALFPDRKIDHVIIPSLKTAICTKNSFLPISLPNVRVINSKNFYDYEGQKRFKNRLSFNKKSAFELINTASEIIKDAKAVHDVIEKYYVKNMDFDSVKKRGEILINEILGRKIG